MALVLNDRVKETTTTTGTCAINLAGAETGFETFVAGIGNSNTCYYTIAHQSADEFEVGLGTVTDASPDTLSRTTIISSSNSDSAVNFSAGTKDVFCTLPASKAVFLDGSGDLEFNAPGDEFSFKNSSNTIAFIKTDNNDFTIQNNLNDKDFILKGYDSDGGGLITSLSIDYSNQGNATFNKNVIFGDNGKALFGAGTDLAIFSDGTDAQVEATGILNLDADNGGNVNLKDGGTLYGTFQKENDDFRIISNVSDGAMRFRGNDGGSYIDALVLDMSINGAATFSDTVSFKFLNNTWINSADGANRFYFTASSGSTYIKINNYVYMQDTSSGANRFSLDGSGNLVVAGNITAYGSPSDIRLKENVEVIDNALEKVKKLKGITYDLKSDGTRLTGLIAQDLEEVLPEAVYTEKDLDTEEEHLAIRYGNTVGLLVEAIKEQQEQIETLTAKVKELEDK